MRVRVIDGGITYAFDEEDWQYDDQRTALHFDLYVPSPGSVVSIQYMALRKGMAR